MKTILLMSCALCVGMNGYGAVMDLKPRSNNVGLLNKSKTKNNATSLLSPKTDQNASSSKRTFEGQGLKSESQRKKNFKTGNRIESELPSSPPNKKKLQYQMYQAYCDMVQKVSPELDDWLNSDKIPDPKTANKCLKQWVTEYQEQLTKVMNPLIGKTKGRAKESSEDSGQDWRYARSGVFCFMTTKMRDTIYSETATHERKERAQAIKKYLEDLPSSEISGLRKTEE